MNSHMCLSYQVDIREENPGIKLTDPCPVCSVKLGYHRNLPSTVVRDTQHFEKKVPTPLVTVVASVIQEVPNENLVGSSFSTNPSRLSVSTDSTEPYSEDSYWKVYLKDILVSRIFRKTFWEDSVSLKFIESKPCLHFKDRKHFMIISGLQFRTFKTTFQLRGQSKSAHYFSLTRSIQDNLGFFQKLRKSKKRIDFLVPDEGNDFTFTKIMETLLQYGGTDSSSIATIH